MSDDVLGRLKRVLSGSYSIEREIETGGMAFVFLAEDLKHNRKVAIKVLKPALAATLATERFLREIQLTARLQHPHVLTLIDSGEAEGLPYYVMPYVEGQSLKDRLEAEGTLALETAVRIACEIADALSYAHEKGIIHRDIKPGNVLLSADHAVVADFGIAGALDDAVLGRLTDTGVSLGSPAYMSPEQASGDREIDERSDVYALGCVLYEMLGGKPPFEGPFRMVVTQKLLGKTEPLKELCPGLPQGVEGVVNKAMTPVSADRFPSVGEFRTALVAALPRFTTRAPRQLRTVALVSGAVAAAALVAILLIRSAGQQALWAAQTLAEVENLFEQGQFTEALALAREFEAVLPHDTTIARLLPQFTFKVPIRTDPPGARVFLQRIDQDEWIEIGVTPLDSVRFAGITFDTEETGAAHFTDHSYRVRFQAAGYQDRELLLTAILGVLGIARPMDPVVLTAVDPELEGMVRLPGFTTGGIEYGDYFIDRVEVTNRDFREFVDAGAYQNPAYWIHPFVRTGRELSFHEAMALFKDQTGRPGPSTWRLGTHPEGQEDYPVGGVSWYEAAAYARWSGKQLPTSVQWNRARMYTSQDNHVVIPRSNLVSAGPRPVAQGEAMTTLGVYDTDGNVREWIYNEAGDGTRATRGGAWTDAPFHTSWIIPKPAFDRDATNGFRLIRSFESDEALSALRRPVQQPPARDYSIEKPASDAEFQILKRLFDYDPYPLNVVVEQKDTFEHWVREKVVFGLPYGERGGVTLYIPRNVQPPYQPVVFWGGSGLLAMKSIDEEFLPGFDFMVRSGRIVAVPIFAGAYGRVDPRPAAVWGTSDPRGPGDNAYREISIRWVKDVRAAIDYLETRSDIDTARVGFFGMSFGGRAAPVVLAVEPRIDAAVLNVGGLHRERFPPEVDAFNFVTRVQTPTLMVNGRYDVIFPYETNQVPMFQLLGTPAQHKVHYTSPAAHWVPRDEVITQTLDWFDKYLGVPQRR